MHSLQPNRTIPHPLHPTLLNLRSSLSTRSRRRPSLCKSLLVSGGAKCCSWCEGSFLCWDGRGEEGGAEGWAHRAEEGSWSWRHLCGDEGEEMWCCVVVKRSCGWAKLKAWLLLKSGVSWMGRSLDDWLVVFFLVVNNDTRTWLWWWNIDHEQCRYNHTDL